MTSLLTRRHVVTGAAAGLVSLGTNNAYAATGAELGSPLAHTHAHNDYLHAHPLLDALSHGFTSVEADVWLVDGELRLGHTLIETRPGRTLTKYYLDPLAALVRQSGRVYPSWEQQFQLLIEVKSDPEPTYRAIESELAKYGFMLTEFAHGRVTPGPVQAVLTGRRPFATIAARTQRFSFIDGGLGDAGRYPTSLVPLISEDYYSHFAWLGAFPMPSASTTKLKNMTASVHSTGAKFRFYNTPDANLPSRDQLWAHLLDCGVDLLNTDDLAGLERFLLAR